MLDTLALPAALLPFVIFGLRVADMTLDTLRVLFVLRGRKALAWFLGFAQSAIWVVAISSVLRHVDNLWNIVGAEKARERDWYAYSPGLIEMGGTWTPEDLDRYLEDAAAFAPGSTKSIRIPNPDERREIIDFLEQLKD